MTVTARPWRRPRRTCATQPAPTVAPRTVSPPGNASASVRRASRRVCVARVARFCRSPQRWHLRFLLL